jgi:Flp pilus assembly pilin Flp
VKKCLGGRKLAEKVFHWRYLHWNVPRDSILGPREPLSKVKKNRRAEYGVMLALILVIAVGTARLIGRQANNVFSETASARVGQLPIPGGETRARSPQVIPGRSTQRLAARAGSQKRASLGDYGFPQVCTWLIFGPSSAPTYKESLRCYSLWR